LLGHQVPPARQAHQVVNLVLRVHKVILVRWVLLVKMVSMELQGLLVLMVLLAHKDLRVHKVHKAIPGYREKMVSMALPAQPALQVPVWR